MIEEKEMDWQRFFAYSFGDPMRFDCLRELIAEADRQQFVEKQIALRSQMCYEMQFYGNKTEFMSIFPKFLNLCIEYPDRILPEDDRGFDNNIHMALWNYKWLLENCDKFYQISREDWMRYLQDFKEKSQKYGYSLRPYYQNIMRYYEKYDEENWSRSLEDFRLSEHDGNCDCKACEQNEIVQIYLKQRKYAQAKEAAKEIESFELCCGGNDSKYAWIRLQVQYIEQYAREGRFDEAVKKARYLEQAARYEEDWKKFNISGLLMYCYVYEDCGRALRLYKKFWHKIEEGDLPKEKMDNCMYVAGFFAKLKQERKKEEIRLKLDDRASFYRVDGVYSMEELFQYYFQKAMWYAEQFDQRNGNDKYVSEVNACVNKWIS